MINYYCGESEARILEQRFARRRQRETKKEERKHLRRYLG